MLLGSQPVQTVKCSTQLGIHNLDYLRSGVHKHSHWQLSTVWAQVQAAPVVSWSVPTTITTKCCASWLSQAWSGVTSLYIWNVVNIIWRRCGLTAASGRKPNRRLTISIYHTLLLHCSTYMQTVVQMNDTVAICFFVVYLKSVSLSIYHKSSNRNRLRSLKYKPDSLFTARGQIQLF